MNNGNLQGWQECKLGDVANLINGYAFKSVDFSNSGTPVVKIKNIASGKLTLDEVQYYSHKVNSRLKQFVLKKGDILIAMTGSHVHQPSSMVGKVTRYDRPFPALLNQRVGKIVSKDPNILSEDYIYYFLTQENVTIDLAVNAGGSANQANISSEQIRNLPLFIPPLPEQSAIAGVLSSLDDKIDLLHRQNKTLEGMVKALWEKMFVKEADPGWQKGKLGDLVTSIETGKRPKGGIDSSLLFGVPSIGAESINGLGNYDYYETKYVTEEYYNSMRCGKVQNYDILIYRDGAYIGKKSMFANGFPFEKCCINEHVFIVRTGKVNVQLFLYFTLEQEELEQLNANSAQPGLNQTALKSFELTIPTDSIINKFGEKTKNYINKIFLSSIEIRTLSHLRDTLLPKLMSGEVRVKYN